MKKGLNIPQKRKRAARNLLLAVFALTLAWIMMGMPSFTKNQAFNRALRQHLLPEARAEMVFGDDSPRIVLGEKDGRMLQAEIWGWKMLWSAEGTLSVTEQTDGVYIVPLCSRVSRYDPPEIVVRSEGLRAELTMEMDGKSYPLIADGKQGDWFVFRFDRDTVRAGEARYNIFVEGDQFSYIDSEDFPRNTTFSGTFHFIAYNADGSIAAQAEREF